MNKLVVAFSGGKDSTALALRLHELGEPFKLLFTKTGDELPEVFAHIDSIVSMTGAELITPANRTLREWIDEFQALPNWRQRWCTRLIKIEPCIAWLLRNPEHTLAVGLRADEEQRIGLYGDYATYRYPLREWGWSKADVVAYNKTRGVTVPDRTDCALCYGQRLKEWWRLWIHHNDKFEEGITLEEMTGHTFRSPGRDTWPAALKDLRAEFEAGRRPRGIDDEEGNTACRVCSL